MILIYDQSVLIGNNLYPLLSTRSSTRDVSRIQESTTAQPRINTVQSAVEMPHYRWQYYKTSDWSRRTRESLWARPSFWSVVHQGVIPSPLCTGARTDRRWIWPTLSESVSLMEVIWSSRMPRMETRVGTSVWPRMSSECESQQWPSWRFMVSWKGNNSLKPPTRFITASRSGSDLTTFDWLVTVRPFIIRGPQNRTVVVGRSVTFQCHIGGDPMPDVLWRRSAAGGNMPLCKYRRRRGFFDDMDRILISRLLCCNLLR